MTGNSLDAADAVLTSFDDKGRMQDIAFFSMPSPPSLTEKLRDLRHYITANNGKMDQVAATYRHEKSGADFDGVLGEYMHFVAAAVRGLLNKSGHSAEGIDAIGFHGQTSAHAPPSAKNDAIYTVQIGNGQQLADLTGIPVIYDFRSDDIMNGGEGAPLAPSHNEHIASLLKKNGAFPIAFINGGNTGNIALITTTASGKMTTLGWDAGPFNHLPDGLMRKYAGKSHDEHGALGQMGTINPALLQELFDRAAVTAEDKNFLLAPPPKSSDPQWYRWPSMLDDAALPLTDRIRTAEYFSAYLTCHSLGHAPDNVILPAHIAVFGGGWKNPVIWKDFAALLAGNSANLPILPQHQDWFQKIAQRLRQPIELKWSDDYGFDGQAMEARIFADMAHCYIIGKPFTTPEITNVKAPTLCGILCYPGQDLSRAGKNLRDWLVRHPARRPEVPAGFDPRWSRAANGWGEKKT